MAEHYGDAAAHLLALCAVAVLGFLAVVTSGGTFRAGAKFVLLRVDPRVVFSRRRRAVFASHFLAILRSQETWISLLVSVALFIYLSISGLLPPVVAVEPLAFLGLNAFSSTSSIRRLPMLRLRPGTAYAVLVASVGALVVPCALFACVVDVLLGGAALPALFSALACLVSVPLFVTLGIVIPTQRDNPISVLVAVALCSSLFRFSTLGWLILALFLVSFAVACGVINARSLSTR